MCCPKGLAVPIAAGGIFQMKTGTFFQLLGGDISSYLDVCAPEVRQIEIGVNV